MKTTCENKWRSLSSLWCAAALCVAGVVVAEDKVTYDDHIAPLLRQRCGSCHNPTDRTSGLDVTNYLSLMEGGASGVVIEGGDASASYLYSLVAHEAEPFMPPSSDKIPDEELGLIERWINGGALENAGSKAIKPKASMSLAVEVDPGKRPEVVPLPPRMVLEPHFTTERPPMARSLATSPWAPLVAATGQRQVLLYNTESLELVGVFAFPEGQPNVVRFSRDGRLLLAGGGRPAASGKVVVWDIATGERVFEVGDELDVVLAADISADYRRIALGGPQRRVRVFSSETGELLYEIAKHTEWVTALEFSPDGVLLATGDRNGGLHLWETHTGNEYLTLTGHTAAITGLSWRGDSNLLASASEDASVRLWEPENGKQVKTWNAKSPLLSVEFARDGRLVTGGRDQIARLWSQDGKQAMETPALGELAISVSFCDETNRAVAASWAGNVRVYGAEDAAAVGELATNPPPLAERLAAAEARLQEKRSLSEPLAAAVQKVEAELAPVRSALGEAEQQVADRQKQVVAVEAEVKQITESRAKLDAERGAAAAALVKQQEARPLVAEALRHLTEAIGKAPGDAALVETQQQLTEKLAAMETNIAGLQTKGSELTAAIAAADTKLKDADGRLEAAQKEAAAAAKRVAALQSEVNRISAALEAARQTAEPAAEDVAQASRDVERWRNEIAFRDQLAALEAELAAARQTAAERQSSLDEANEQLAAAQAAVEAAAAGREEASRTIDAVQAKIEAARTVERTE